MMISGIFPIDGLSLFMAIIIASIWPLILVYSFAYIKTDLFRYYSVFILTLVATLGVVLSKDFLSFYIFLGMMTASNFFLIIQSKKTSSMGAAFKYIIMMLAGGFLILVSILMLNNLCGTFSFAGISKIAGSLPNALVSYIFSLFVVGCLFEIGAVPFHTWLPDAHPAAPSPISAMLSGITIKIGAYGIIRMLLVFGLFPGHGFLSLTVISIGLISMVFGVFLALMQTDVKRLLAYSSISQMGYILLGSGVGGIGLVGSLFHILNHAIFKALLFLSMGAVIYSTGQRELSKLGGLWRRMPFTLCVFAIGALSISAVPPFNGFMSKSILLQSVSGNQALRFILIFVSAGTFALFIKMFIYAFFGVLPEKLKNVKEAPLLMLLPMFVLSLSCLLIGIFYSVILANFIFPALNSLSLAKRMFASLRDINVLYETLVILISGFIIYFIGEKTGFLKIKKEPSKWTLFRQLSLDNIYSGFAVFVGKNSRLIKRLHARSLNIHLLWIFLALMVLLILFRGSFTF